jgi:hypothetical protein
VNEPGLVPARPITLTWKTFTDAANQAAFPGDMEESISKRETTGRHIADQAWSKAMSL